MKYRFTKCLPYSVLVYLKKTTEVEILCNHGGKYEDCCLQATSMMEAVNTSERLVNLLSPT